MDTQYFYGNVHNGIYSDMVGERCINLGISHRENTEAVHVRDMTEMYGIVVQA
jgi:hypothetical protein